MRGARLWLIVGLCLVQSGDRVKVSVNRRVAVGRATITALVTVEPHAENRWLKTVLDGESYYAASTEQLDGAEARRVRQIHWRGVPPGHYLISAALLTNTGKTINAVPAEVCIAGREIEC